MKTIFKETLGDAVLELKQKGPWFDIYLNGAFYSRHLGKARVKPVYRQIRKATYADIKKLPVPATVRGDVARLLAATIEEEFRMTFVDPQTVTPDLRDTLMKAAREDVRRTALYRASAYAVHTQRVRGPISDLEKMYYANLEAPEKGKSWKLPPAWEQWFERLTKYADRVIENMLKEGGVNQAWTS